MDHYLTLLSWGSDGWGDEIFWGVVVTIGLALATLPLGLAAGLAIALGKQSRDRALNLSANIYTTIFRGLPELLTLFLVFFGLNSLLQTASQAAGLPFALQLSSFASGMLALGLVFSAFASEVLLSAFRAIPPGQTEGAKALGLSAGRTMALVVLPQLVRIALPGLANLWMNLLKDTALVSVVGLADTLRQAQVAARVSREPFLFFGIAILAYLVLTMVSSVAIGAIERRVRRGEAAR